MYRQSRRFEPSAPTHPAWPRLGLAAWLVILLAGAAGASLDPESRPAGTEIVARRDAVSRHIAHGDGTVTAHIYCRPIHRLDDQGRWIPIGGTDDEQTIETFEYILATGHCAYDGSDYGKTDMGLIKVEREVTLYPASAVERVGWMRFDLSSIPDWAYVTWVECHFIVTYFEMSMGLAFTCLEADPVPTGAETLFDAIYAGEVCAMGSMPRAVAHWDLGPIAAGHIQKALALAQDWVAFGQVGYDYSNIISKRGWIIGWNASPREHAPHLTVTYQDTPPTPSPTAGPPTGTPTPTPTPVPTQPPLPTKTPTPTAPPLPTMTPVPSPTAEPSATLSPSPTAAPTGTPTTPPPLPAAGPAGLLAAILGLSSLLTLGRRGANR